MMDGTDGALFGAVAGLFASGLDVARVAGIKTSVANLDAVFMEKTGRRGPDECWPWRGFIDRAGYGRWRGGRRQKYSHRHAWELAHGAIPAGMHVYHKCGNRRCVNVAHLYLAAAGTKHKRQSVEGMSG